MLELYLRNVATDDEIPDVLMRRCCGVGPKGRRRFAVDAPLLQVYLKTAGGDLCGVIARKTKAAVVEEGGGEIERGAPVIDDEQRQALGDLARGACATLAAKLVDDHVSLRRLERRSARDALTHGSLTDAKEKALEDGRKAREKLLGHVAGLADALDVDAPVLREDLSDSEDENDNDATLTLYAGARGGGAAGAFDDEAQRAFYEDAPNVRSPELGIARPSRDDASAAKRVVLSRCPSRGHTTSRPNAAKSIFLSRTSAGAGFGRHPRAAPRTPRSRGDPPPEGARGRPRAMEGRRRRRRPGRRRRGGRVVLGGAAAGRRRRGRCGGAGPGRRRATRSRGLARVPQPRPRGRRRDEVLRGAGDEEGPAAPGAGPLRLPPDGAGAPAAVSGPASDSLE